MHTLSFTIFAAQKSDSSWLGLVRVCCMIFINARIFCCSRAASADHVHTSSSSHFVQVHHLWNELSCSFRMDVSLQRLSDTEGLPEQAKPKKSLSAQSLFGVNGCHLMQLSFAAGWELVISSCRCLQTAVCKVERSALQTQSCPSKSRHSFGSNMDSSHFCREQHCSQELNSMSKAPINTKLMFVHLLVFQNTTRLRHCLQKSVENSWVESHFMEPARRRWEHQNAESQSFWHNILYPNLKSSPRALKSKLCKGRKEHIVNFKFNSALHDSLQNCRDTRGK